MVCHPAQGWRRSSGWRRTGCSPPRHYTPWWEPPLEGQRAGQRVQRPPVRHLGRATGRWARHPARYGRNPMGPMEIQLKGSGLTLFARMGMAGRCCARAFENICAAKRCMRWASHHARPVHYGFARTVRRETLETAAVVTRVSAQLHPVRAFRAFRRTRTIHRIADAGRFVIEHHYPMPGGHRL